MICAKHHLWTVVATIVLALATFAGAAQAQITPALGAKTEKSDAPIKLPDPLTQQAIRDVLSTLDDGQVRTLLIQRLSDQAKAQARALAEKDDRSLIEVVAGYGGALATSFRTTFERAVDIPTHLAKSLVTFDARRGDLGYIHFFLSLFVTIGAGLAAVYFLRSVSTRMEERILNAVPANLWQKLALVAERLMLRLGLVVAFVLAGYGGSLLTTTAGSPDRYTALLVLRTIGWIWFAVALARFMLAPGQKQLRLCPVDDWTAGFVTWRVGVIAVIAGAGFGLLAWMLQFGMTFGAARLGFWVNLAMHGTIIATVWQTRRGITAMLSENDGDISPSQRWLAQAWPAISIGLVAAHWLIAETVVATGNATAGLLPTMMISLAVLLSLPIMDHGMQALIENLAPADDDQGAPLLAAHRETQKGMIRCGRVLLGLALVAGLLRLWQVDVFSLAEQGGGARFASALIDIVVILLLAYAVWEFVTIVTQRQIAIERATLGLDDDGAAPMAEGEGGKGETRLATILPLVRLTIRIAVVALAALTIVNELGVNITPLLAGAGIIGLAIGFGAQTLVKDIISGLFFLIDDAFRKGEYIDIGDVKGTVEKISVRSMQLRHHNGPLNTVPFGEINFITNFSRDWVVMKLPFRLTYDTDAEAVRKMIKKLGQEMLEDPVLGPMFLQPLKSQGVIQMEDSAMIMRVKFMTRPGDQWVIRRIVFARIRDMFEANGIKFAHREVTVRLSEQDNGRELSEADQREIGAAAQSAISDAR